MGTVVLFPQDCLRPRSRHKQQTSEMINTVECAPAARRYPLHRAQSQGVGLPPLLSQDGHSSPIDIPHRGLSTRDFKFRKAAEQRRIVYASKIVPDDPVYKILQTDVVNIPARFVVIDDMKPQSVTIIEKSALSKRSQNGGVYAADKCNNDVKAQFGREVVQSDGVVHRKACDAKLVRGSNKDYCQYERKDMSRHVNGVCTSSADRLKISSVKVGVKKALNDPLRGLPPRIVSQFLGGVVPGDASCKAVIVQPSEEPHNPHYLCRTSTEPQVTYTHTVGQYKSKVIHASLQLSKSEPRARDCSLFGNTSTLSCQERWAGPAYSSSPPPSSLPLPKLCLPPIRLSPLEIPPLVKQYSNSVYKQPFLGSSTPSEKGVGAWDVAFATKSLRQMLNLDPCQ